MVHGDQSMSLLLLIEGSDHMVLDLPPPGLIIGIFSWFLGNRKFFIIASEIFLAFLIKKGFWEHAIFMFGFYIYPILLTSTTTTFSTFLRAVVFHPSFPSLSPVCTCFLWMVVLLTVRMWIITSKSTSSWCCNEG